MKSNIKIIECISNIHGIDITLQGIKENWTDEKDSSPLQRELTAIIYLKLGIINRELFELRRLAKQDDHLNRILLTLAPFLKELDYYQDGIKTYRDRYIAHYNRGNNHKFQSVSNILSPNLVLPRANAELELLIHVTHFFSKMMIHFYRPDWSRFQKKMLDELEAVLAEFGKNFKPRTPVKIDDYVAEVNDLAVQNGLVSPGTALVVLATAS